MTDLRLSDLKARGDCSKCGRKFYTSWGEPVPTGEKGPECHDCFGRDGIRCDADLYTTPGLRCGKSAEPGMRFCKRHSKPRGGGEPRNTPRNSKEATNAD